jgi:GNAT superfamily N-acetyltransferase
MLACAFAIDQDVMRHVNVRPASVSKQRVLEALQWRASLDNLGDREALLAHPDAIALPLQQIEAGGVFVAERSGSVMGFAAILPHDDGNAELDALFVEPAAWRQGIGRVLVEHGCAAARVTGAASLHVVGNPHAEGFCRACGLALLGTTPMRYGVGLLMMRDLLS